MKIHAAMGLVRCHTSLRVYWKLLVAEAGGVTFFSGVATDKWLVVL